jgi:hypothetical protein
MELITQIISSKKDAPVAVLFGGSPVRRAEVVTLFSELGDITIYGTLSEEEGIEKLQSLEKVDLVLIGGRYDNEQRKRIKQFVDLNFPNAKITEPGFSYTYRNDLIKKDVIEKLDLK